MKSGLVAGVAFAAALVAGIVVPLHGAHAVTIINGSFEQGPNVPNGSFLTLNAGDGSLTGWTINSGNIDYIQGYWLAADGTFSLDMNGFVPGSISQTLTGLTPNQQYKVSFELAGNPAGGPEPKTLSVTASAGSGSYTFDASNSTLSAMGWVTNSFIFTATGSTAQLTFASTTTGDSGNSQYPSAFGPALDNISISATPLPSTWLMLLSGFVGLGFFAYRRKNRLSLIAA